jgi:hypothetical protein
MENQSDIDLANTALNLVGSDRIVSLDNTVNSKVVQSVNQFLSLAKQETLRARDWNRARGRATLAALDASLSLGEWSQAYRLPPDCLCMRRFIGTCDAERFAAYNVEIDEDDKQILFTNCGTNKIVYTRNIVDVNRWDSLMFRAAVQLLASYLVGPLIRDFKMQQMKTLEFKDAFEEAIGTNEGEGGPDQVYDSTLVSVRHW